MEVGKYSTIIAHRIYTCEVIGHSMYALLNDIELSVGIYVRTSPKI